jgi:hypothetical protein
MILAHEARSSWRAAFGVLLTGSLVLSCSDDKSSSTSAEDAAISGSDAAGTGGGAGGMRGIVTGGSSGSLGGTTGTGGALAAGTTGSAVLGVGGRNGTGAIVVAGTGGSAQGAGGGVDAAGAGGGAGATGAGGAGGNTFDGGMVGLDGGAAWPKTLAKCEDATDDQLRSVVYGTEKAPEPYNWDALPGGTLTWDKACASDLATARSLAKAALTTLDRENATSPYYYEFVDETSQSYDQGYRVTRCEFYDGAVLGQPYRNLDGLGLLASYLWFIKNHNSGSHKIVASAPVVGSASPTLFLCYTLTVYGDWGLSDDIRYYQTRYALDASGSLTVADDEKIRNIQGKYNPNPLGP